MTVIATFVLWMSCGGISKMFLSSTIRSASLPTSIEPTLLSSAVDGADRTVSEDDVGLRVTWLRGLREGSRRFQNWSDGGDPERGASLQNPAP
jgi:hypothetical protein